MPPPAKDAKVEAKDIAPNWKVLQMKIKEDEANAPPKEKKEIPYKTAKKKRKFNDGGEEPMAKKTRKEEVPVTGDDKERGELTRVIAIDCEYVGVGDDGKEDSLARVSIVNEEGKIVYDKFVRPKMKVVDYRTAVSGIRPGNLVEAARFEDVQKEVHKIMEGRIVVGHALHNDMRVLALSHPRKLTRDTFKCKAIRQVLNPPVTYPSLKLLASKILGIDIQQGEHDSIVDARVALRIYLNMKKKWEDEIRRYK
ncbi:hypothetical protein PFISCL1PPCAC_28725 [Pristionchus fissidentatus]|uniref:RNA exonuclease 4 n=1 Tax=Pristionchus fissidentatus TaxID=1538716 RepID=A0AAV5V936_9BILA|nr:hypothetical protein PFISCL1PPCAC_6039 [Pristionchus fissidentatus]GMT37428.1 hypothetical protein PFISCL1PPCAC_28725 [Pristionchus fissidentatus]